METTDQVIKQLRKYAVPKNREGMARFVIDVKYELGV